MVNKSIVPLISLLLICSMPILALSWGVILNSKTANTNHLPQPVVIIEKTITQCWAVSLPLVDSGEVGKGVCYITTPENLQRVSIPLGFIEPGDKWRAVPFDSQEYFLGSQQECVDWLYKVYRERLR